MYLEQTLEETLEQTLEQTEINENEVDLIVESIINRKNNFMDVSDDLDEEIEEEEEVDLSNIGPDFYTKFNEKTKMDFNTFYNNYYNKLNYYLFKITKDKTKAEDAISNTFLTAIYKIDKFDPEKANFSTWLFTIGRNVVLQDLNKSALNRNKFVSLDVKYENDLGDSKGESLLNLITDNQDNSYYINRDLNYEKVKIFIRNIFKLKNKHKSILIMREIKNKSYQEISEITNTNISTTKSQIKAARKALIAISEDDFKSIEKDYEKEYNFLDYEINILKNAHINSKY